MTPYDSENLSAIVEESEGHFIVYRSPATAEDDPNYEPIAKFPTLERAETYLKLCSFGRY
jgi:hypothetical protein